MEITVVFCGKKGSSNCEWPEKDFQPFLLYILIQILKPQISSSALGSGILVGIEKSRLVQSTKTKINFNENMIFSE